MTRQQQVELKKQNIFLFGFLSFITFGLYQTVWFWKQREEINKHTKKAIRDWQYLLLLVSNALFILPYIAFYYLAYSISDSVFGIGAGTVTAVYVATVVVYAITFYVTSFQIRRILLNHFSEENKYRFKISWFWTLAMGGLFYLQYKINHVLDQQADPDRVEKFDARQEVTEIVDYSQYYQKSKKHVRLGIGFIVTSILWAVIASMLVAVFGYSLEETQNHAFTGLIALASLSIFFGALPLFIVGIAFVTRKELISGSSYDERSGQGPGSGVPWEVNTWSWGAAFLGIIWGAYFGVWWSLLMLVPVLNGLFLFVMGVYGNAWAWQQNKWISVEHFEQSRKKWNKWGIAIALIMFALTIVGVFVDDSSEYGVYDEYGYEEPMYYNTLDEAFADMNTTVQFKSFAFTDIPDEDGDPINWIQWMEMKNKNGELIEEGIVIYTGYTDDTLSIDGFFPRYVLAEQPDAAREEVPFSLIETAFWETRVLDSEANPVVGSHFVAGQYREYGIQQLNLGNYGDTELNFSRALDIVADEDNEYRARIYSNLAIYYNNIGEYERSQGMYEKALDLLDENYFAYHSYSGALAQSRGQRDAAIAAFTKTLEMRPTNYDANHRLGRLLIDPTYPATFDCEQALPYNKQAYETRSTTVIPLAENYICLRQYEEARDVLEKALEEHQYQILVDVYANLSYVSLELEAYDDAEKYYRAAQDIDPLISADIIEQGLCEAVGSYCP